MTFSRNDCGKEPAPFSRMQLEKGETDRHTCLNERPKDDHMDSWVPLVELLEELELSPLEKSGIDKTKFIGGLLAFGMSLALFLVLATGAIWRKGMSAYPGLSVSIVILFLLGVIFCLFGSSSNQFRWMTVKFQTISNALVKIFQVLIAIYLWSSCGLLIFFIIYPKDIDSRNQYIVALLLVILAVGFLCAMLWNQPVPLRIIELRAGLSVQGFSAGFEVSVLVAFSAVAVASLSRLSLSWESVACALLLGLVGYWAYRWRKIEESNSAVIDTIDRIRTAARRVNLDDGELGKSKRFNELLDSYRELQLFLLSGTKHVRQRVISFGLLTLCAVADARRNVGVVASELVHGSDRIPASQKILDMTDEKFAHASAQLFDGIQRMMSDGFYPQMSNKELKKERKGNVKSDLYHYLRFWSLRF